MLVETNQTYKNIQIIIRSIVPWMSALQQSVAAEARGSGKPNGHKAMEEHFADDPFGSHIDP